MTFSIVGSFKRWNMRRLTILLTVCAMLVVTASASGAPLAPRFEAPRVIASTPRAVTAAAAADRRGHQVLVAAGYDGPMLFTRGLAGSWEPGALPGLAGGQVVEPVSVAAAGDGVAAVALTQGSSFQPGGDGRGLHVWVRDRPLEHFDDAGTPSAGADQASVQPAVSVDGAGRVLVAFLSFERGVPSPSRARVAIAVREPGQKSFGLAGLVGAPGASAPSVASSAAGRAVVTWTEGGRVQALSVERGSIGRVVTLGDHVPERPVVAVGPRGEAVVAWRDLTNRILASTRGRTGAFRRAVRLGRPPMMLWDHPAVAVGRDGHAMVAWGSRVVLRGAAPRRGARCDRIQARLASTRSGRFGPLRRVDCAPNVSQPAAGPAGDGVVLTWTVREHIRGPRTSRAALARDGSISRPANVGDRHGSGSQTEVMIPWGMTGASLIWLDTRPALPARLVGADARTLDQRDIAAGTSARSRP